MRTQLCRLPKTAKAQLSLSLIRSTLGQAPWPRIHDRQGGTQLRRRLQLEGLLSFTPGPVSLPFTHTTCSAAAALERLVAVERRRGYQDL